MRQIKDQIRGVVNVYKITGAADMLNSGKFQSDSRLTKKRGPVGKRLDFQINLKSVCHPHTHTNSLCCYSSNVCTVTSLWLIRFYLKTFVLTTFRLTSTSSPVVASGDGRGWACYDPLWLTLLSNRGILITQNGLPIGIKGISVCGISFFGKANYNVAYCSHLEKYTVYLVSD